MTIGSAQERQPRTDGVIPLFGRESFVVQGGDVVALRVGFNGGTFDLPRRDVSLPDQPEKWNTIFYLNISPANDPELFETSVNWYEQEIIDNNVDVLVIPKSGKSTESFREAVRRARLRGHTIRLIELLGGTKESDVADAHPDLREFYIPITTPGGKFMGMKYEDALFLSQKAEQARLNDEEFTVWVGDDVKSTDATIQTIIKVVNRATDSDEKTKVRKKVKIKQMVICVEIPEDKLPLQVDEAVVDAAMAIVEVSGGVSPTRLL